MSKKLQTGKNAKFRLIFLSKIFIPTVQYLTFQDLNPNSSE